MNARCRRRSAAATILLTTISAAGCGSTATVDYDAVPLSPRPDSGARMVAEREGLRVTLGPPSQFPYGAAIADSARDTAGVYRLYTRVRVENTGSHTAVVRWDDATLTGPDGTVIPLAAVDVASAGGDAAGAAGAGRDRDADDVAGDGGAGLPPGRVVIRGLLPAALDSVPVGRPLVELCDGCSYRLRLPARIDGGAHVFRFSFRLTARESGGGIRFLPWDGDR